MLGRYRLETLLGCGGMAEVWRADDTKLGRPVAVKVILAAHASERSFVERFLREARVVASLEHPNILPVYDFGEEDGDPFLVMPLLDGGTLRDRMVGRPVPLPQAATWIGQLAGALDAAHEAGVLHRDVKPANVLIGKGDRAFLADFGIAKMLETATGLTATGMVVGTPLYMAPEQAQGNPATPATDRYALAVIAYELLAGKPPFEGENPLSLMHQHVTSPAPALSSRVAGLPAGLDAVFARALAKDPAERHPKCAALASAIGIYVPTGIAAVPPHAEAGTAPTMRQTPHPTPAIGTAPGRSGPGRPHPVATPPPGLTSDQTVFTGAGRARKRLAWGVVVAVAAVSAMAVGFFILRGKENPATAGSNVAKPAASPLAAAPESSSKVEGPGTAVPLPTLPAPEAFVPNSLSKESSVGSPSSDAEARKIAELEARLRKAEKELASDARGPRVSLPAPVPEVPTPPPPAAKSPTRDEEAERTPSLRKLKPVIERLDPTRRPAGRLTRDDFEVAVASARKALAEGPETPEARYLEIYGSGGLEYVARNDGAAAQALVEAFVHLKRAAHREVRSLAFLLRGPGGSIVPPTGWQLALAYGDARGEAEGELSAALTRNPDDAKALLGRAYLSRMQGRTADFLADLRRAAAANPAQPFRAGILEMLRSACRGGVAEACAEAKRLASAPVPRKRFSGAK